MKWIAPNLRQAFQVNSNNDQLSRNYRKISKKSNSFLIEFTAISSTLYTNKQLHILIYSNHSFLINYLAPFIAFTELPIYLHSINHIYLLVCLLNGTPHSRWKRDRNQCKCKLMTSWVRNSAKKNSSVQRWYTHRLDLTPSSLNPFTLDYMIHRKSSSSDCNKSTEWFHLRTWVLSKKCSSRIIGNNSALHIITTNGFKKRKYA